MIQGLLFPAFGFIERNPVAQVIVGLGVGYIILKARDKWRDRNTEKRLQRRNERRSRKQQESIRKDNNAKLEKTRATRADPPRPVSNADGLSGDQRRRLIRD